MDLDDCSQRGIHIQNDFQGKWILFSEIAFTAVHRLYYKVVALLFLEFWSVSDGKMYTNVIYGL